MQNSYTGQFGIVLLPDEQTNREAMRLSAECGRGNSIDLGGRHTPHLTLYHSKLTSVPTAEVRRALDDVKDMLPIRLSFTEVAVFGGMYLFWDTERAEVLMKAHERTLDISRFFIPAGEQPMGTEKISLSSEEDLNIQKYGHPLVRALWRPHVTLGYYPQGISREPSSQAFEGFAVEVAFVRVGEMGTIAEIIDRRV